MAFIDKHLSEDSKTQTVLWLQGDYESTWIDNFCNLFDQVFGQKHLSLKCFIRSSVASILAVVVLFVLFSEVLDLLGTRTENSLSVLQLVLLGAAINIVPDYLSLFETRWLLQKFKNSKTVLDQINLLILDLIFSGSIILFSIVLYLKFILGTTVSLIELLAMFSIYSIFFYSTFITSVWAWLYFFSSWFVKLFSSTPLIEVLDVKNRPVTMIGFVGAAIVFILSITISPFLIKTPDEKYSSFDKWLCSTFPETICTHTARISKDDILAAKLYLKVCRDGNKTNCLNAFSHVIVNKVEDFYPAIKHELNSLCEDRFSSGCFYLGMIYEEALAGENKNQASAEKYYNFSCEYGLLIGCEKFADILFDKEDQESKKNAVKIYDDLCSIQNGSPCVKLMIMHQLFPKEFFSEIPSKKDLNYYMTTACSAGMTAACVSLGKSYEQLPNQDIIDTYTKLCNENSQRACFELGYIFEQGLYNTSTDIDRAKTLYKKACVDLPTAGCFHWANAYLTSGPNFKDLNKGIKIYEISCNGGVRQSCDSLGLAYSGEFGITRDLAKAILYFESSCSKLLARSCKHLSNLYLEKESSVFDVDLGISYLKKACNLKDYESCFILGVKFTDEKIGSSKDREDGLQLLNDACENEFAKACLWMTKFYFNGNLLPKNKPIAIEYARKACNFGEISACDILPELINDTSEEDSK